MKIRLLFLLVCVLFFVQANSQLTLEPHLIVLEKGLSFSLQIPKGYQISVAAEGMERPRFFAKAPDGRLFITDMHNRDDDKQGRILLLGGWNATTRRFEKVTSYMDKLHNPNQIAFYNHKGQQRMYVAETHRLVYYTYKNGSVAVGDTGTTIAHFPDYGLSYKYGGWHLTRSIAFHRNKLYLSVGSSCNACLEKVWQRASIIEMDPDGAHQKAYATGLRNAVGITSVGNQLWATNMGRDLIGPDKPEDQLMFLKAGADYGWPFYYQYQQHTEADKQFADSARPQNLQAPPAAFTGFLAHSAPLGLTQLRNFDDPVLKNRLIVALHGSTSVWRQRGNEVVVIGKRQQYQPLVTGFLQGKTEEERYGRPCDVFQWDERSFFISDDKNGVVYYVWKE